MLTYYWLTYCILKRKQPECAFPSMLCWQLFRYAGGPAVLPLFRPWGPGLT